MPEGAHCGMKINMKTVRHTTSSKLGTVQTFLGLSLKIFINSLLASQFLEENIEPGDKGVRRT